jgi:hypothetical protein
MRRTTLLPSTPRAGRRACRYQCRCSTPGRQEAAPTTHDPAAMHAAFMEAIQVNDAEDRMTPRPRGHREPLDLRPCGEGADMV